MSQWMSSIYGPDRTFQMTKARVSVSSNPFDPSETSILATIARGQMRIGDWLHAQGVSRGVHAAAAEGKPVRAATVCELVDSMPPYPNLVMECAGGRMSERASYCATTRKKHGVIPHKSKGSMTKPQLVTWKANDCGAMFHKWHEYEKLPILQTGKVTSKKSSRKKGVATTFHTLPIPDCLESSALPLPVVQPLVAVLAGSTSRKEEHPSNATLSAFTVMLPSLMRSLDCGFRYVVVLGYDKGDSFYDSEKVRKSNVNPFCCSTRTCRPAVALSIFDVRKFYQS
jgi:hypothetical protein